MGEVGPRRRRLSPSRICTSDLQDPVRTNAQAADRPAFRAHSGCAPSSTERPRRWRKQTRGPAAAVCSQGDVRGSPGGGERGRVQSERSQQPLVFEQLSDMLAGFMSTQALSVAVQLGVPDVVSIVPMNIAEIANRVGADESSLYRLLRFLSSEGVFAELEPRQFSESPLSRGLRTGAAGGAHWLAIIRSSEEAWSLPRRWRRRRARDWPG
jgi:hypothetical protein